MFIDEEQILVELVVLGLELRHAQKVYIKAFAYL